MMECCSSHIRERKSSCNCSKENRKTLRRVWEFSVAKIEENETALDCLKRELKEEFSIEIESK
jgi:8-oxo-dGTP pyrophosphatase MutT (NUDIX family)